MALTVELKAPRLSRVLAGSRAALEAVIDGTDPAVAAAIVLVENMRAALSQPGSGEIYEVEFRFSKRLGRPIPWRGIPRRGGPHRASAPGEPPAVDSGDLRRAVGFQVKGLGRVGIGVTNEGAHFIFQEFGTRFIDPRPFIRPGIAAAEAGMIAASTRAYRERARRILAARRGG